MYSYKAWKSDNSTDTTRVFNLSKNVDYSCDIEHKQ